MFNNQFMSNPYGSAQQNVYQLQRLFGDLAKSGAGKDFFDFLQRYIRYQQQQPMGGGYGMMFPSSKRVAGRPKIDGWGGRAMAPPGTFTPLGR